MLHDQLQAALMSSSCPLSISSSRITMSRASSQSANFSECSNGWWMICLWDRLCATSSSRLSMRWLVTKEHRLQSSKRDESRWMQKAKGTSNACEDRYARGCGCRLL